MPSTKKGNNPNSLTILVTNVNNSNIKDLKAVSAVASLTLVALLLALQHETTIGWTSRHRLAMISAVFLKRVYNDINTQVFLVMAYT